MKTSAEAASADSAKPLAVSGLWWPGRVTAWLLGYWAIIAGFGMIQDLHDLKEPVALAVFLPILANNLLSVGVWIGVCVLVFLLSRSRTSLRRRDIGGVAVLALAIGVLVTWAHDLLACYGLWALCMSADDRRMLALVSLPNTIAITVNVFAAAWTVRSTEISREHHARASMARSELTLSQTRALEQQLRPHFLFNTLQSVATLVHRDAPAARNMLLGLRALLQHSVASSAVTVVPLGDELNAIGLYLDIERWRFTERLETAVRATPEALNALIPPLLLQPLVENALYHAVAIRGSGRVEIDARLGTGRKRLHVLISDTGPGSDPPTVSARTGIGLQNARSRLQVLYGSEWNLEFRPSIHGGSTVEVVLPYRTCQP